QAVGALKIWTGRDAPVETMKKSLLNSLGVQRG
ncbi:MAG: shikimate dehydrogenase, partial [Nitrososphaerota archaeon]|nr:shikimate dehydrogenase [Nitrososphaerota archaeon]